jgi:hypothetical protein
MKIFTEITITSPTVLAESYFLLKISQHHWDTLVLARAWQLANSTCQTVKISPSSTEVFPKFHQLSFVIGINKNTHCHGPACIVVNTAFMLSWRQFVWSFPQLILSSLAFLTGKMGSTWSQVDIIGINLMPSWLSLISTFRSGYTLLYHIVRNWSNALHYTLRSPVGPNVQVGVSAPGHCRVPACISTKVVKKQDS